MNAKTVWAATLAVVALVLAGLLLPLPQLLAGPGTAAPAAAAGWSSGWEAIDPGQTLVFDHNLGGDPDRYAVQLWFLDTDSGGFGVNTRAYGGLELGGNEFGAAWQNLTGDTVEVYRYPDDTLADRVRIWVWMADPPPDYCSPWTAIGQGATETFTHDLGGDENTLSVGLWFSGTVGINQRAYGGMEEGGSYYGAYWHHLTADTIQVSRLADDPFAAEVRVCVTRPEPPDFDSDWVDLAQGQTSTIDHDLGGNLASYSVRVEFQDSQAGGWGINHYAAGGLADGTSLEGDNWQNLTATSIDVFRRPNDVHADQVRVRIWRRSYTAFLPYSSNNYTP
jgi:hypothetical protein